MKKILLSLIFLLIISTPAFAGLMIDEDLWGASKSYTEQEVLKSGVSPQDFIKYSSIDGNNFSYSIFQKHDVNSMILLKLNFENNFEGKIIIETDKSNSYTKDIPDNIIDIKGKDINTITIKEVYGALKISLVSDNGDRVILQDFITDNNNRIIEKNNYQTVVFSYDLRSFDFIDSSVYLYGQYDDENLNVFNNVKKVFIESLAGKDITNLKNYVKSGGEIFLAKNELRFMKDSYFNDQFYKHEIKGPYNTTTSRVYYKYGFGKIYIINNSDYSSGLVMGDFNSDYEYINEAFLYSSAIKKYFFIDNKYILIYISIFVIGVIFIVIYSSRKKYYFGTIWGISAWVLLFLFILSIVNIVVRGGNDSEFRVKVNHVLDNQYVYTTNIGNLFSTHGGNYQLQVDHKDFNRSYKIKFDYNRYKLNIDNNKNENIELGIKNVFAGGVSSYKYNNNEEIDFSVKNKSEYEITFDSIYEFTEFLGSRNHHFRSDNPRYIDYIGINKSNNIDYKYYLSDNVLEGLEVDIYYKKDAGSK